MLTIVKLTHGLSGDAGQYYVCAELTRRGFLAAQPLKNAEGIDILASRPRSERAISIQVKSTQGKRAHWILKKANEAHHAPAFFYILVRLREIGSRPYFHIVPSKIITERIAENHKNYLSDLKSNGQPRKDTNMRSFEDDNNEYLEKWQLLDRPG